jgi:hypothetical protein
MCSMSAGASPHIRLQRALDRGNLELVRLEAAACSEIELETALRILLLIADSEPDNFDTAAAKWAGRLLVRRPGIGLNRARGVLEDLAALNGHERTVAAGRLALALRTVGEVRAAAALERSCRA